MWSTFVSAVGFGVVLASIISVAAMGFTIQFGLTNVLNLSFGAVMTVAAFVAYLANSHGVGGWSDLAIGGVAGAALTLLLGRGIFKPYARRGAQLFEMMMVTLGLSLIIDYAVQAISHNNIYQYAVLPSRPFQLGAILITHTQLIIVFISIGVLVGLLALLRLTKVGKALRAMAADPDLARACGIRTGQIVVVTWLLSGFLCGLAGVVYIINTQSVGYTTGELFLPLVVAAAILGGAGSPLGAVLASLIMGIVTEVVSAFGSDSYSTVAGFGILVLVLLSRPGSVRGGQAGHTQLTL
ncbi:MAG TPA: branched-chain amino acid ABC transporter permease [Gaiellaceae bacterium]|nr:branched-chain amino acid ABC transporter permease [Gaiellaceae bacterium]